MQVTTYLQPTRTYLPCTGVGRFINNVLLRLSRQADIDLSLLVSKQYLSADGTLNSRTPLCDLPLQVYPYPRLLTERLWKLFNFPKMDDFVTEMDCFYSPVVEYVPFKPDIPTIITMYDTHTLEPHLPWSTQPKNSWQKLKTNLWLSKAFERVDHICTISEFSKRRIIELTDTSPDKISVVGCGVEDDFFDKPDLAPDRTQFNDLEPFVVVVGGLKYKKGADYLLAVARELKRRSSNLTIVVAGTSEDSYLKAAGTFDNILVYGLIPDETLRRLMYLASSLLFLSLYEGFGIPALEAMAAGVPAVVANRASLPEVVGDAGIVVEPSDTCAIADILINLERDTSLRQMYSDRGRQRAVHFTWDRCAEKVYQVLKVFA